MKKLIPLLFLIGVNTYSINSDILERERKIKELELSIKKLNQEITKLKIKEAEKKEKKLEDIKIGVVLSGGGSKALAHIGLLKILDENKIPVDYITGTSMGAIIAALYSVGYTAVEIEYIVNTLDWEEVMSNKSRRLDMPLADKFDTKKYAFNLNYTRDLKLEMPPGFYKGQKTYLLLKSLLWSAKDIKDFSKLPIPLKVVATDLDTGEAKTFEKGDLAKAISASMSIPTVFEPVKIDGKNYVDGVMSKNLPVEDVIEMGANIVIASDVGATVTGSEKYNIISILNKINSYRGIDVTKEQQNNVDYLLNPEVAIYSPIEFDRINEIVELGELTAREKAVDLEKFSDEKKYNKRKRLVSRTPKIQRINSVIVNGKPLKESKLVYSNLEKELPSYYTKEEIEHLIMKLYATHQVNRAYYEIRGNTLYIDIEETAENKLLLGLNYSTDYGAKFALGTNIEAYKNKNLRTTIEGEVGSYNMFKINQNFFYGSKNKINFNVNLAYEEEPFYSYSDDKKWIDLKYRETSLGFSVAAELWNQVYTEIGLKYSNISTKFNTKSFLDGAKLKEDDFAIDDSYEVLFINALIDRQKEENFPKSGLYGQFYMTNGGVTSKDTEFVSSTYTYNQAFSLTENFTLRGGFSGGFASGADVPAKEYIKIGGGLTDLENKNFKFVGLPAMGRSAKSFFTFNLDFQYEFKKNLFLTLENNALSYESSPFDGIRNGKFRESNLSDGFNYGYGVSLGYNSPLGPLKLTVSNDLNYSNLLYSISIGHRF